MAKDDFNPFVDPVTPRDLRRMTLEYEEWERGWRDDDGRPLRNRVFLAIRREIRWPWYGFATLVVILLAAITIIGLIVGGVFSIH